MAFISNLMESGVEFTAVRFPAGEPEAEPDSRLEAALERWRKTFEEDLRK